MFPVAVAILVLGYGLMYTGLSNSQNGGKGPTLGEALAIDIPGLPGAQMTAGKKLGGTSGTPDQPTFTQL